MVITSRLGVSSHPQERTKPATEGKPRLNSHIREMEVIWERSGSIALQLSRFQDPWERYCRGSIVFNSLSYESMAIKYYEENEIVASTQLI